MDRQMGVNRQLVSGKMLRLINSGDGGKSRQMTGYDLMS